MQMNCRPGCGACCIEISISSSIPRMPDGKAAGVRCVNLDDTNNCRIHNSDDYPTVCRDFKASYEMCGDNNDFAFDYLRKLEEYMK